FATARPALERVFLGLAGAADAFPSVEAFFSYSFWQVLLLGGMLVASGLVLLLAVRGRPWIPFACGLVIIDLFLASAGFHAAVDPDLLEHTPDAVRWLTDQPGDWRITTYDTVGAGTLNANTPWLFNLADVRGYDSIIPRQFTEFMALIEPQNGLQFNRVQPAGSVAALESPLLDALAVKYVIASEPIDSADFRPVWDGEGVTIYENLSAAPRAYTLPVSSEVRAGDVREALSQYSPLHHVILEAGESSGSAPLPAELQAARISGQSNNEIIVEASPSELAWLIVGDSFAPGWRAYVRPADSNENAEQEAEITRVNGNFRGVRLAAGDWIVRMRYSPRSFQLGGLMSFMGVTVLVFALGTWVWRRLYRPEAMATTTRSVAKNSAAPMTLNLFNKGIDFVFAAFYLRVLGPADAGSFATAIAAAGIFEIVANYGLNILLIRDVSQDKAQAGRFLLNSSVLRLFTALIAAIPIVIYVVISARGTNPLSPAEVTAIFLMMIGMVFSGLALGVSGLFYVYEEAEIPAAMATVTTIVKVALGVAVLLAGFSFVGLAAVSIASNVFTLVMLTILAA
ncbi:MAG TPA: oligosaccharide flippase family protein, partial [Promineifilum sp.]